MLMNTVVYGGRIRVSVRVRICMAANRTEVQIDQIESFYVTDSY